MTEEGFLNEAESGSDSESGQVPTNQSKDHKRGSDDDASIQEARKRKLKQIEQIAPSKHGKFVKAYKGHSLRAGIDANCLDCQGFDLVQVRNCTVLNCPLWPYRPYQNKR